MLCLDLRSLDFVCCCCWLQGGPTAVDITNNMMSVPVPYRVAEKLVAVFFGRDRPTCFESD